MPPARLRTFSQRIASTTVEHEVAMVHKRDDDLRNMKLVLGTNAKKPLHVALNELDRETATRLAFKYFSRIKQDAQAHGCSILHGDAEHIDADTNPIRQVVLHPPTSAREALAHTCDICLSIHLYHRALLLNYHNILARVEVLTIISTTMTTTTTTCLARPEAKLKGSHDKSPDKRRLPPRLLSLPGTQERTPAERAALEEAQLLKSELDRLRSHGAVQQVMPRQPTWCIANPNKVARRVTTVEFSSDSDDE